MLINKLFNSKFFSTRCKRRKGKELSLEDGKVSGHSEPLAYLHNNEDIEESSESEDNAVASETTPDSSLSGIFK